MLEDSPQDSEEIIESQSKRIHALVELLESLGFPVDELVDLLASV